MIQLTFSGDSSLDILQQMEAFIWSRPMSAKEGLPKKEAEPPKPTAKKPVEKPTPVEASVAPKSEPSTDLFAEIRAIIPKLVKAKGRPAVVDLLAEFGATSGGEIKEEDRVKFLEKAKSLLPE